MIYRTFNPADVNPILNDPSVFDAIRLPGIDGVDVTPLIQNPGNVFLMAEGGCIIFIRDAEGGIYEVHTAFLEHARGAIALRESRGAYRWMFTNTDCMILQTRVPAFNHAAAAFCSRVGAAMDFERRAQWPTDHGLVDVSFWSLKYEDWIRRVPPDLIKVGRDFHARLDDELALWNRSNDNHPDEDCHDLYVGACVATIYAGQSEKAVILYNRWARFAGYQPIALVSKSPLLIDIGTAIIQVVNESFKVVQCR